MVASDCVGPLPEYFEEMDLPEDFGPEREELLKQWKRIRELEAAHGHSGPQPSRNPGLKNAVESDRYAGTRVVRMSRERLGSLVMTALAVLARCGAASAQAAFPGENGKIVFVNLDRNDDAIFTVNPDGSGARHS